MIAKEPAMGFVSVDKASHGHGSRFRFARGGVASSSPARRPPEASRRSGEGRKDLPGPTGFRLVCLLLLIFFL